VTGFALAGHGWEMAERSGCTFEIATTKLPMYPGVLEAAQRGVRTGGDARNRTAVGTRVTLADGVDVAYDIVAFDPQTSGGLLAAVDQSAVAGLTAPGSPFVVIGNVVAGTPGLRLV
jgi:selenide,water dikinase